MCTIGHSFGSACGTTHTYTGFSTFRAEPHLRSMRLSSSTPLSLPYRHSRFKGDYPSSEFASTDSNDHIACIG
jgi:hypothetical protein